MDTEKEAEPIIYAPSFRQRRGPRTRGTIFAQGLSSSPRSEVHDQQPPSPVSGGRASPAVLSMDGGGAGSAVAQNIAALRRRRPSLAVAVEGDDDDFATRERLAQRVALTSAALGQAGGSTTCCAAGVWLPIVMVTVSIIVVVLPLDSLLVWSGPNAWGVQGKGCATVTVAAW
eukprot:COSAG01_NODE_17022_length_1184_cov_1.634101_1_plen_173_part_00